MLDYTILPKIFKTVLERELDYETLNHLEYIWETGGFKNPSEDLTYAFSHKIKEVLLETAKLYGVTDIDDDYGLKSILFSIFMQSYPVFDELSIKDAVSPRKFIVGSEDNPLPFVGGANQGNLNGISYQQIENIFGPPTYSDPSSDNKVQVEWDIKFDNGVRASIYDYKQYGVDPGEIEYWSIGGNSPESSFEVFKSLRLL